MHQLLLYGQLRDIWITAFLDFFISLLKDLGLAWVQLTCNTTDDALALLKEQGLAKPLLCRTARYVKNWIETWSGGRITAEAVTFSTAHQLLGATENWQKLFDAWQETSGQSNLETMEWP